jgi:hypothetical protein
VTSMPEVSLPGGHVNAVVRVGDTVRRAPSERGGFVHALLRHLERRGWGGAPRFLGMDEAGREVLGYLDGHVAWEPPQPAEVTSDASLARVAELVRELHDLTAGSSLAGDQEVVCHNDLSPRNTVYHDTGRGLRPVAFIDWASRRPGGASTTSPMPAGSTRTSARAWPTRPRRAAGSACSATPTAWTTAARWSTRSCGGRTAAGAGSRPGRPEATPRCSACAIPALRRRCGAPTTGWSATAPRSRRGSERRSPRRWHDDGHGR